MNASRDLSHGADVERPEAASGQRSQCRLVSPRRLKRRRPLEVGEGMPRPPVRRPRGRLQTDLVDERAVLVLLRPSLSRLGLLPCLLGPPPRLVRHAGLELGLVRAFAHQHGERRRPGDAEQHGDRQRRCEQGLHRAASAPPHGLPDTPRSPGGDRTTVEVTLQLVQQVGRGRVPCRRLLLQALQADRLQVAVDGTVALRRRDRVVLGHLPQRLDGRRAEERRAARQQRVENRAQRVHVGGRSDQPRHPGGLFRRHVAGRPLHHARLGQPRVLLDELRQPEVGHLRVARLVQQHVARLQVPVHHVPVVCVPHGLGDLKEQLGRTPGRKRPLGQQVAKRPAGDERHRVVVQPLVLAHLVDGDDARVLEPRRRLGLGAESPHVRLGREMGGEDRLECDVAVQSSLPRSEDDPHAAPGDLLEQVVLAEPGRGTCQRERSAGLVRRGSVPGGRGRGGGVGRAVVREEVRSPLVSRVHQEWDAVQPTVTHGALGRPRRGNGTALRTGLHDGDDGDSGRKPN